PEEPHRAFEPLGLTLGGPLYPFLGGVPLSLRLLETPPELFPFGRMDRSEAHVGVVVDDPGEATGLERAVASLEPESAHGCRILAPTLPAFLAASAARALREGAEAGAVEEAVAALRGEME